MIILSAIRISIMKLTMMIFHNVNTTDNDNDVNKVDNSDVYRKRRTKIEVANQTKM